MLLLFAKSSSLDGINEIIFKESCSVQESNHSPTTKEVHEASLAITFRLWIVAAVYSTYLAVYFVTGSVPYDREYFYWHEGILLTVVILVLCSTAAR